MSLSARQFVAAVVFATAAAACASLLGVDDVDYGQDGDASAFDGTAADVIVDDAWVDGAGGDEGGLDVSAPDGSAPYDATPFVLQHLGAPPTVLATDGFTLFWAAGRQIYRSDGGTNGAVPFFDAASAVQQLVDQDGFVVWSTLNAIESSPVAAPAVVEIYNSARPFAVGGANVANVYFRAGNPTGFSVNFCAVNAGCQDAGNGTALGAPYPKLADLVGATTAVYFIADIADGGGTGVFACPLAGGCLDGSAPSVPVGPQASALSVMGKDLYWVESAAVLTTPTVVNAVKPKFIANGETSPHAVVSDGSYVYWTSADGVRVKSLNGGDASTLAPATNGAPTELVVFGNWIVWLAPASQDVVAAARPK